MPTLSEINEHAADAEHQAFQRAYDELLNVAKDPITCRHFWDAGFTAGQADANDMLTVAYMDGYSKGREAMRAELESQEPLVWECVSRLNDCGASFLHHNSVRPGAEHIKCRPLFAHPMPPPDVRELVEALRYCRNLIGAANVRGSDQTLRMVDAALAKFGEKS